MCAGGAAALKSHTQHVVRLSNRASLDMHCVDAMHFNPLTGPSCAHDAGVHGKECALCLDAHTYLAVGLQLCMLVLQVPHPFGQGARVDKGGGHFERLQDKHPLQLQWTLSCIGSTLAGTACPAWPVQDSNSPA